jgi:hypothetical protein
MTAMATVTTLPRPSLTDWRDNPRPRTHQKYGNVKTEVAGEKFDSKAEARRWVDLQWLEKAGKIRDLRRQVKFVLIPAQKRPSGGTEREKAYVADFVHVDVETGRTIVSDVKGAEPAVWALKRALMLYVHGVEIEVVRA